MQLFLDTEDQLHLLIITASFHSTWKRAGRQLKTRHILSLCFRWHWRGNHKCTWKTGKSGLWSTRCSCNDGIRQNREKDKTLEKVRAQKDITKVGLLVERNECASSVNKKSNCQNPGRLCRKHRKFKAHYCQQLSISEAQTVRKTCML